MSKFLLYFGNLVNLLLSSPMPVDVRYNSAGLPYIPNAIVPGLSAAASQTEVRIGIDRGSFIDRRSNLTSDEIPTGEIFTGNMIPLCSRENPARRFRSRERDTLIMVGIGPGSQLLDTYATISMIRSGTVNGQMILGGQLAAFNRSCVSGSVLRIPYNYVPHYAIPLIRLTSQLSFSNRVITTDTILPAEFGDNSKIATLPYAFLGEISSIIVQSGASRVDEGRRDYYLFRHCNRDILLRRLPDLVLRLGDGIAGEVVLGPEDYIHFDHVANECLFKFGVESISPRSWRFNPLVIPDVNVHITNREIFICDSIH